MERDLHLWNTLSSQHCLVHYTRSSQQQDIARNHTQPILRTTYTYTHIYDDVIWSHESHVTHTHQQRRGRQEGALRCWSSAISLRDMPGLVTAGNPSSWSLTCFSVAIVTEDRMQCEQKKTSTNWSVCATTLADLPQFYVNGGSSNNEIWYTD